MCITASAVRLDFSRWPTIGVLIGILILNEFYQHQRAVVHFPLTYAAHKCQQHEKMLSKLLGMLRIEPRAVWWEARTLPLSYAVPPPLLTLFFKTHFRWVIWLAREASLAPSQSSMSTPPSSSQRQSELLPLAFAPLSVTWAPSSLPGFRTWWESALKESLKRKPLWENAKV